jgi:septum formation protein
LILASGSPQRRAILEQLGVAFRVVVSNVDELTAGEPEYVVGENALRKAAAVAAGVALGAGGGTQSGSRGQAPPETILGVDTLVELDGRIFGKPADREQAAATLRELAGRSHRVLSGLCVIESDSQRDAIAVTTVHFRPIGDSAMEWYLNSEEWRGRAGGYAIQGAGAALVESIEGDYLNVVGLPVAKLIELLPALLFPAVF